MRDSQSNLNSVIGGGGAVVGLNNQGEIVHECLQEFPEYGENKDDIVCLILIKSGTLIL